MDDKLRFCALVGAKESLIIAKRIIQKNRLNFTQEDEDDLCMKVEECIQMFTKYARNN